jgi:hypothetical protein
LKPGIMLLTKTTVLNGYGCSKCGSTTSRGLLFLHYHSLGLPVSVAGTSCSIQIVFHTLMMLHGLT